MGKIKGGDAMLFVGGKSIAYATSHTLHIAAETQDTSNKDEGGGDWSSNEISILSWDASSDNFYAYNDAQGNTFDTLKTAMVSKTPVTAVFAEKSSTATSVPTGGWTYGTPYYKGNAIITDLNLTAANGEYATFTAQFQGQGALETVYA